MCGSPEVALQWHQVGFVMLGLQSDTRLLAAASEDIVEQSRRLTQRRDSMP
jgi:hypothetical protein